MFFHRCFFIFIFLGKLVVHSLENGYRVLWSMRQQIESGRSNEELEKSHFKIVSIFAQFQLLQNEKVALFLTHCGEGGVVEALFTKTLMVLFPTAADQYFNAERVEQLGAGLVVRDEESLSDLEGIIERLLLNEEERRYYQNAMDAAHAMIGFHGGVAEAVDFIEYTARFGIDHLMCTYGVGYDCKGIGIPWYQRTMGDVYFIVISAMVGGTVVIKFCILDVIMCRRRRMGPLQSKLKTQ